MAASCCCSSLPELLGVWKVLLSPTKLLPDVLWPPVLRSVQCLMVTNSTWARGRGHDAGAPRAGDRASWVGHALLLASHLD